MHLHAMKGESFLGAAFFQFQTAYWKGGSEMNFGLFGLGEKQIGETGEVCDRECQTWPVHCLTTNLSWLAGTRANRARAVATAWGGSIDTSALCSSSRRLDTAVIGTTLSCQIRARAAGSDGASVVAAALSSTSFHQRIINRTKILLGVGSDALQGGLSLTRSGARVVEDVSSERGTKGWDRLWVLAGVAVGLLIGSSCGLIASRSVHKRAAKQERAAARATEPAV